jgi:hypothetical protein
MPRGMGYPKKKTVKKAVKRAKPMKRTKKKKGY